VLAFLHDAMLFFEKQLCYKEIYNVLDFLHNRMKASMC
jgi:hypothetical protein